MRVFLFILKFFLLAAFFIISNNNLALSEQHNRIEFFNTYKFWIIELGNNLVSATGNIVKLEWLPNASKINVEK